MKWIGFLLPLPAFLILCVLLSGCTGTTPPAPSPDGTGATPGNMTIQVDSLAPGSTLPVEYTCAGAGISPAISWTGVPADTRSLVLILHDPDAPLAGGFTHWLVYNIPPDSPGIPGNVSSARELPGGGLQGQNGRGTVGYVPPCPPNGSSPHHYMFQVYALNTTIDDPNPNRSAVLADIQGHTIGQAQVVMMFGR
jgi:Raf kinase inhibitor-like YbhB/YbcL family protein